MLDELDIPQPEHGIAHSLEEVRTIAERIGYPVLVRPSFVLGGRAMAIVGDESQLEGFVGAALAAAPGQPLLIDRFLEDAYEIDVDAIGDGERVVIGAIMQHIEEAGVHSGDSACVLPPYKISAFHLSIIREYTERLGLALGVRGLMNVQFAIKDDVVYVLEVNPRASRTMPYVSKATGRARWRASRRAGDGRADPGGAGPPAEPRGGRLLRQGSGAAVPEAARRRLPARAGDALHRRGDGARQPLRPCLRQGARWRPDRRCRSRARCCSASTISTRARRSRSRAICTGWASGCAPRPARRLSSRSAGLPVDAGVKVGQGSPHVVDLIRGGKVQLVLNTPLGPNAHTDGNLIRAAATVMNVPLLTTLSAAAAAVMGIRAMREKALKYRSLQDHFRLQEKKLS